VAYEGTIAEAMTADPLGRYFYVVDHAAEMYVYRMAPSTGALTEIEGSPYAIGSTFATPVVDPCGRFVYVPNYGQTSSTISGFAILPNGGTLAPIAGSPFAGGEAAIALAIDPTGRFLYSANFGFVAVYTINSSTGALTFIANVSSGQNNNADIAVDPSGRFLYLVANNDVFAYSINSTTGLLTAVPGSPFATDILPEFLTLVDHIH
jgi:6-phosphogluconolactonase (cycloisomerase 2 family)